FIYVRFIAACQREALPLHYAVHVTGHGWRKLMRLPEPFVYRITDGREPTPPAVFRFIAAVGHIEPREMYGAFNMGAGFAVYVDEADADRCVQVATSAGYTAWRAGRVARDGGRKAVVIEPLNLTFEADSLRVR